MAEKVYLTHKDSALRSGWFEISLNSEKCEDVGTPYVPIDKSFLDRIAPRYHCKNSEEMKNRFRDVVLLHDNEAEKLWEKYIITPYAVSLGRAQGRIADTPTCIFGDVTDVSWLENGDVNLGGCFLDACFSRTIKTLIPQIEKTERRVFIVPELTVCVKQPGNSTFQEVMKELNSSSLKKIEIKHLDEIL